MEACAADAGAPQDVAAEPWLDEQVASTWLEVEAENGSSTAALPAVRSLFDAAEAQARERHRDRTLNPPPGPRLSSADLRRLFARDLGFRFRSAFASMVQGQFDRQCLLPEQCRDERARRLLGDAQLAELRARRVVVIDWALTPKEVVTARREAETLDAGGRLKPQATFSGYQAREDRALYISDDGDGAALASAVCLLRGLAEILQEAGGFGNLCVPKEAMLACYPGGGARYTAHKDSTDDDPRRVTCILYLQTLAWRSNVDGGELSVVPPGEVRPERIEPTGGRLVIFDSRTVEHEVLPARSKRMALTLWLRRAPAAASTGCAEQHELNGPV